MPTYFLGTDIGTGSVKAVAVDLSGRVLDSLQYHYPQQPDTSYQSQQNFSSLPSQPSRSEQDAEQLWTAWRQTVASLIARQGAPPACISLSSAMHGLMALDKNNQPLTPLLTWADLRASGIAAQLRTMPEGKAIYEATGTPVHAMSPLCKLAWWRENEPELFQSAHRFASIKEYIWQKLFGDWQIDHSIASATGLFDIRKKQWHTPALEWAGIRANQLSGPCATTYLRSGCHPAWIRELGIDATTTFCMGASDGCLASLASGAVEEGSAAITIGTSGAVRRGSKEPLLQWPRMIFSYILDEENYICGGPVNNGGNIAQWLLQSFFGKDNSEKNYPFLFNQWDDADTQGLVFLPHIFGERAPVWNEQSRGVYFGLQAGHGRAHFIRAALEGVCFNLKQILLELEDLGGPVQEICVSGGFVQSPQWLQLLADVVNKRLHVLDEADSSALGAALLALKAMGHEAATANENTRHIEPQNAARYEKNFALFQQLYPALQHLMHQP